MNVSMLTILSFTVIWFQDIVRNFEGEDNVSMLMILSFTVILLWEKCFKDWNIKVSMLMILSFTVIEYKGTERGTF